MAPSATTPRPDAVQKANTRYVTHISVPGLWERCVNPNLPPEHFRIPDTRPGEIIYITKGYFLTKGGTARLERLVPSGDVIKSPIEDPEPVYFEDRCQNMRLEARIYEAIGPHPRIPTLVNWDPHSCCLTMEYLENGSLAEYIQKHHETITLELRRRWARQAAEGLAVLHSVNAIHCDISPRNFLLDSDLELKIADFGGGSLEGSTPSAVAETRYRYPVSDWDVPPVPEDDVFGLGSLIYLIMTGRAPYEDIPEEDVESLFESGTFPDLTNVSCADVIEHCWRRVKTPQEVYAYLEALDKR